MRAAAFQGNVLFTKAGSPGTGGRIRWGLLPDQLKAPLDEAYGALDAPWTVAYALRPGAITDPRAFRMDRRARRFSEWKKLGLL